jgi:hypothetical protein
MVRRAAWIVYLAVLGIAGCKKPTPSGTVLVDWHRSDRLNVITFQLAEDIGPARAVTSDLEWRLPERGPVRLRFESQVGEVRVANPDPRLAERITAARAIRLTVLDAGRAQLTGHCDTMSFLRPGPAGSAGYAPNAHAVCMIQEFESGSGPTFTIEANGAVASGDPQVVVTGGPPPSPSPSHPSDANGLHLDGAP